MTSSDCLYKLCGSCICPVVACCQALNLIQLSWLITRPTASREINCISKLWNSYCSWQQQKSIRKCTDIFKLKSQFCVTGCYCWTWPVNLFGNINQVLMVTTLIYHYIDAESEKPGRLLRCLCVWDVIKRQSMRRSFSWGDVGRSRSRRRGDETSGKRQYESVYLLLGW